MKRLPTTFRSGGFSFKILRRDGDIALFRKTKPGLGFESFEVVVIQRHETFEIKGKLIPAGEHLSRSEQWGIKGWTYSDRLSADRRFNQLKKVRARAFGPLSAVLTLQSNQKPCSANQSTKKWPSWRQI
jgi:hypothetical protein